MASLRSLIVKIGADDSEITKSLAKLGSDAKVTADRLAAVGGKPLGEAARKSLDDLINKQRQTAETALKTATGLQNIGGAAVLTARQLTSMNRDLQEGVGAFKALGQDAPPELRKVASEVQRLAAGTKAIDWNSIAIGAKTLGAGLTAAVTVPLIAAGAAIVKFGIDAVESENLASVSFGSMKAAADDWSKGLSKSLGLNEFELRKQAGTLFNMTTAMGVARDASFGMSTGLTKLAADMSSLRNIPIEDVFIKLRSGLTGETEPLKAIGILVDEATTKTYAYSTGIAKQGEALTQQQKVLARYQAILAQTANDQGDLARTIDSPANQLRILRTRVEEAATSLGVAFMPLISRATGLLSGMGPQIQSAAGWIGRLNAEQKAAIVGFGAFAAGIGPAIYLMGTLAGSVANLIPLFKLFNGTVIVLGASLGALQLATGLGLFVGLAYAATEVGTAFKNLYSAWQDAKSMWDFFAKKEDDTFLRRWLGWTDAMTEARRGIKQTGDILLTEFVGPLQQTEQETIAAANGLNVLRESNAKLAAAVAGLTGEQKEAIARGRELGRTAIQIGNDLGISGAAVTAFTKEQTAMAAANEKAKNYGIKEGREYKKLLEDLVQLNAGRGAVGPLGGSFELAKPAAELKSLRGDLTAIAKIELGAGIVGPLGGAIALIKPSIRDLNNGLGATKIELDGVVARFLTIPDLLQQAFTGGGGFGGALQALASGIGSDIVGGLFKAGGALNSIGNKLTGVFGDAFGLALPGIGAAIGSIAGPLITKVADIFNKPEWKKLAKDVGRDFGVNISDALAKSMEENSKNFGRQAAGLLDLDKIIAEGGGLNAGNFAKFAAKLRDTFSLIETGQLNLAQGAEILNENWAEMARVGTDSFGFIGAELQEIIALNERFGTQAKEITAFLKQQGAAAVSASSAVLTSAAVAATTSRQLQDLGVIALSTFAAAVASGSSFSEALKAAGPGLTALSDGFARLGIEVDNAALKTLLLQNTILAAAPNELAAINGLGDALVALTNLRVLDVDSLRAMERTGIDAYSRLQGVVAAAGGTTRDALLPMQDYLQKAEKAARALGIPLDDTTQILIDQSKELKIWKETGLTAAEKQTEAVGKLVDKMEEFIKALMGIPSDRQVNINVRTNYTSTGTPPGGDTQSTSTSGAASGFGAAAARILPFVPSAVSRKRFAPTIASGEALIARSQPFVASAAPSAKSADRGDATMQQLMAQVNRSLTELPQHTARAVKFAVQRGRRTA